MIAPLKCINGKCLLNSKKVQLERVTASLQVPYKESATFSMETYYTTGFFEAEGYFNVNSKTTQCSITLSQKESEYLEFLKRSFGGSVYFNKSWNGYLYSVSDTTFLDNWFTYFLNLPLIPRKKVDYKRFRYIVLF